MANRAGKKRGRDSNEVFDPDGKLVDGLSFDSQGYYYTLVGSTRNPRKKRFGRERIPAIRAYRGWQVQQEGGTLAIDEPHPRIERTSSMSLARSGLAHPEYRLKLKSQISKEAFLEELARWLADPVKRKLAAQITGYELERLEALPPPTKSIPLQEALKNYLAKKKTISAKERQQVKSAWDHFAAAVNAGTLKTITQEAVEAWAEGLLSVTTSKKYAKNRIRRVITVLRYNRRKRKDEFGCNHALALLGMLDMPSGSTVNPKPISKADFHKLLGTADAQWRAILITALNCCYYGIDIIQLPVSAVSLEGKSIVFQRGKTGVARVASLWGRTVEALAPVLEGRTQRKHVFESKAKGPYTSRGLQNAFNRLRWKAGLPFCDIWISGKLAHEGTDGPKVEFNQIRDGAYTAACAAGVPEKEARILAGHRFAGESDAYVMRNPHMVINAVTAIEAHYFG
jgi:hypothetical protein